MPADIRTDPLTGTRTLHAPLAGKPLPRIDRHVNTDSADPCAFCELAHLDAHTGDTVTDNLHHPRTIRASADHAVVVDNRYPVFTGAHATHELVIAREHVTSLEDAFPATAGDIGALLWDRYHAALNGGAAAASASINVGTHAGGSVAHLHGQVNATDLDPVTCPPAAAACLVCIDRATAHQHDLHLHDDTHTYAYMPHAPSSPVEVRITSRQHGHGNTDTGRQLLRAAHRVLKALRAQQPASYNVLLHPGEHPHLHILWRVDFGVIYPREFDVTVVPTDLGHLAASLRTHLA